MALFCGQPITSVETLTQSRLEGIVASKSFESWKKARDSRDGLIVELIKHVDASTNAIVRTMAGR